MKNKNIIITADDLGIDEQINMGIAEAYSNGLLTSSALLVNTPKTDEGIKLAKKLNGLEVGLHLSIVEGISLTGKESSVTDDIKYFDNQLCMVRHWKDFLKKYFTGKIKLYDLEEELDLQFKKFKIHFEEIPFVNGTQHLHILPGVIDVVLKLAVKYKVKAIRLPSIEKPSVLYLNKRFPVMIPFQILGSLAKQKAKQKKIKFPGAVLGMPYSGQIDNNKFLKMLNNLPSENNEIVMHPGYNSLQLRNNLPWAYSEFNWELEKNTLTDPVNRDFIKTNNIKRINFSSLN